MKTALWTAQEIASVTQGQLKGGDFAVQGISIDTRTVSPGDLFIALKGPRYDGHDFVQSAVDKGAAGVLVQKEVAAKSIVVNDTMAALHDLGAGGRARSTATVFAVTGSVGKTSTKDMLAKCLESLGQTHAAEASLNNHWGVPLSLARMPRDARYGVFELGMNHANEIAPLSKMVSPHIAIITTVAPAHIQNLGSIENIALAKSEIFHGMNADGVAVLPRDSEQFPILLAEARTQGIQTIKTFGLHPEADTRIIDIKADSEQSVIEVLLNGEAMKFILSVPGTHQALNAAAVLTAVAASGADVHKILPVFETLQPVAGRGNRFPVQLEKGKPSVLVIDETHNASPVAVEAALRVLAQIPTTGRRVIALGDMLELGEDSPKLHAGLKDAIEDAHVDVVLTSGPLMKHLAETMSFGRNRHFADSSALTEQIFDLIRPGDVLLVKGSRGAQMKRVVDALKQFGQVEAQDAKSPLKMLFFV